MMNYLISLIIVSFNYILRTIIIGLIKWIGKKTYAKQYQMTFEVLFVSQFINSGLVLFLVTFNFEDSRLQSFAGKIFNGEFKDFTETWYEKVGSVYVQTLFVIGLSPVIDCALKITLARYKYY
jgi:hypothetical protein